ncbi:MAG: BMP family ABC transporter substrate-binding protein [Eubacteriaceae bacterium]|nr:BMP family ABC transporter substrate-binding protein [Eubacteriaceae bacterium]
MAKRAWALAAAFAVALTIAGCSRKDKQVMLVTDQQGTNDHSYSQWAEEALREAASEYSFKAKSIVPTSSSGYMDAIAKAAKSHPIYTLISSPKLENAATLTAQAYPEEYFVLIDAPGDLNLDGLQDSPNIFSALFSQEQMGYIAGYAAGLKSAGKAAFIGENEYVSLIEYESGFLAGAKAANPNIETIVKYFPTDMPADEIKAAVTNLTAQGADIAFSIAERPEVYAAFERTSVRFITLSTLPTQPASRVMTVNKEIGKAVGLIAKEYHEGRFKGQIRRYTASDECVSYTILDDFYIPKALKEKIRSVYSQLGTLDIPMTRQQ